MGSNEVAILDPLEAAEATEEAQENDGASLEEVLWQYRAAILDLAGRVYELERRPQFAASLRTKRIGH